MIRIIKINNTLYTVRKVGETIFQGTWPETKAWCYWCLKLKLELLKYIHELLNASDLNVALFDKNGQLENIYKEVIKENNTP